MRTATWIWTSKGTFMNLAEMKAITKEKNLPLNAGEECFSVVAHPTFDHSLPTVTLTSGISEGDANAYIGRLLISLNDREDLKQPEPSTNPIITRLKEVIADQDRNQIVEVLNMVMDLVAILSSGKTLTTRFNGIFNKAAKVIENLEAKTEEEDGS